MTNKFSDWLFDKFTEWEKKQTGRRSSYSKYAEYLGFTQPQISAWIKGDYKPNLENAARLANILGPEVYDALDLPRPDPDLQALSALWPHLSEVARRTLREQGEKYIVKDGKE